MANEFPAMQPAYMGEWTFINTVTPPPANTQLRLNNGGQDKATRIYVSNITVNGINATDFLMGLIPGCSVRLVTKGDATKWQSYAISGEPIQQSGYVELTVTWLAGGTNLAQAAVMFTPIAMMVRATGSAVTTQIGSATTSIRVSIPVASTDMVASVGEVGVVGDILLSGQAFPSVTPMGFSPGMTLRQWYAGQAMLGFASNSVIANLIGKVSAYAFKVADSMIEYEAMMKGPPAITLPPVGTIPPPPTPPSQAPSTVPIEEVLAMQAKEAAE